MKRRYQVFVALFGFGLSLLEYAEAQQMKEDSETGPVGWLRACVSSLGQFEWQPGVERCDLAPHIDTCAGISTFEMRACAKTKYDAWMLIVDDTYQALVEHFETEALDVPLGSKGDWLLRLETSQADWLRFVDSQCIWEGADYLGGTGESTNIIACRARMARDRAQTLLMDRDWYLRR